MRRLKNRKQIGHDDTPTPNPPSYLASGRTLGLRAVSPTDAYTDSDSNPGHRYIDSAAPHPNTHAYTSSMPDPAGTGRARHCAGNCTPAAILDLFAAML